MTHCSAGRWRHERAERRAGSGHYPPAVQAVASTDAAAQCAQLAEQAVRERPTHLGFLEAVLQADLEEREHRLVERRIRDAHLPRLKTLGEFDFSQCLNVSAQQIHEKLTQSQRIPSRIDASGIASTRDISNIARSRSSGRLGAKPNPHMPIITVVTPFQAELVA
jgi:IstB-like ATP binding protein